jgi:PHD/YefM family antitoxin component YafN of YafNO toxin-antitoxin module
LANLKNTTGIFAFCKEANEVVVANRNGEPKLVLMSREVYENGLGKVTEDVCINVKRDIELVAEPVLIRTFNNPAEMVRICESVSGQIVPVLRNGVDELYVMDYESYRMRKGYLAELLKNTIR